MLPKPFEQIALDQKTRGHGEFGEDFQGYRISGLCIMLSRILIRNLIR
jgi:hypothetical protein